MNRIRTRKYRALQGCAALLLAVLALGVTGIYRFLPHQGVALTANRADMEEPKIVKWFYDPTLGGLYALVDGRQSMMLCQTNFYLLEGWMTGARCEVETWNSTRLSAGLYSLSSGDEFVTYLFGRVDAPDIQRLELEVIEKIMDEPPRVRTQEIPPESIFEENGQRYFLLELEEHPSWFWEYRTGYMVSGWSDDGALVKRTEVRVRDWSSVE